MGLVTIVDDASMDVRSAMNAPFVSALKAGEALLAAAPCYIKNDGKVYMSISTQTTISGISDFVGFTPDTVASGMPVTLYGQGTRFNYSTGLTPGSYMYIGATAGRLDSVKQAANDSPVAFVVSATDIVVK